MADIGSSAGNRYDVIARLIDGIVAIVTTLMICGTVVLVAYWTYLTLATYAGKSTLALVAISFVTDFKVDRWLAYAVGGSGVLYGVRQKRLRQKNIERLTDRPQGLERRLDPKRTSSGLTSRGTTQPGDR